MRLVRDRVGDRVGDPVVDPDQPSTTLWAYSNRETPKLLTRSASEPHRLDAPAPAVTTTEAKSTRGDHGNGGPDRASDALWLATGRRRLTVQECAALMGWPRDYPLHGNKTSRYRQVGNGCTPAVVEALGRAVLEADE